MEYLNEKSKAKGSLLLAIILLFTSFSFQAAQSVAEEFDMPAVYEYAFFDAFGDHEHIKIVGDPAEAPVTNKVALYGSSIYSTQVGEKRSFEFQVPESGYYLISFQGYLYKAAGIAKVSINEEVIGTYDFYDPGSLFGPEKAMKTMHLDEGTHFITFENIGRNPQADPGLNYSMYAYKFTLTEQPGLPNLELETFISKDHLLKFETAQITALTKYSDGTIPTDIQYSYESLDETVATVDELGVVTGAGEGEADIIVTATLGEEAVFNTLTVLVEDKSLESIHLSIEGDRLPLGGVRSLALSGFLSNGEEADLSSALVEYRSDDVSVVSISQDGEVRGEGIGSTTVYAEVELANVTRTASLNIQVEESELSEVILSIDAEEVVESQVIRATVQAKLDNGEVIELDQAAITFVSETPETFTLTSPTGFFKAVGVGEAKLSATVQYLGVEQQGELELVIGELTNDKTRSTIYSEDKVNNARNNVVEYNWAKSYLDGSVADAAEYIDLGWEFLWNSVPPQSLPRSYAVNQPLGSPVSGKQIDQWGNYPYRANPVNEPWKIIDPSAKDDNGEYYRYPTNDFKSYYESGLDEQGVFQRELADPQFLMNELYPEKGETWGVDDGYGWIDDHGNYYTFIAYYTHWHLWYSNGVVIDALKSLRDAYIYSGDAQYAQAGIILLDRIADVYPSLDLRVFDRNIYWHSDGGRAGGKAVGSIWETSLVKEFVRAYDAFYPALNDAGVMADVIAFLADKGSNYNLSFKDSATGIMKNIEDGIVRQVYPSVKNANILGNNGFHQSALAMAAVVLDTMPETKEWLDFNFQSGGILTNPYRVTGGNILAGLVNTVDRDGHGNESAPGYNRLWISSYLEVANLLEGYDKYPEADLYQNVKFRKMFSSMYPLMMIEQYTPTIGDTGAAGNPMLTLDRAQMIRAFEVYRDPIFAQLAYFMNNQRTAGIHSDVFSADPDQIGRDIEAIIDEYGSLNLGSTNLTGYGFSALRDGIRDVKTLTDGSMFFTELPVVDASVGYAIFEANSTLQLEATAPGHFIEFEFNVEIPGDYEVMLRPWRAPSYARYNVFVDQNFAKEVDFFGSSKELELLTTMNLSEGSHTIRFEYSGITDGATNYKMGVTELVLREPTDDEVEPDINTTRGLWMYHGISTGHGHRDTLNLGLHAYGLDLAPDLGYPMFADSVDMHRHQWMNNTISHNTVVVNKRKQERNVVGLPLHYDGEGGRVQLTDIAAPKVYTPTSEYRRTSAMIHVNEEDSYVVDFFKVTGGNDHHFSFHSMEGEVTTEGLDLVAQKDENGEYIGSYAGADVPFTVRVDDVEGANYMGSGFHWLKDVDRAENPAGPFSVEWNVKDTWNVYGDGASAATDVNLRLTMLTEVDEVALANGVPPDNKAGNPSEIRYMIAHRNGEHVESLFTSIIEPYKGERYVESIEPIEVLDGEDVADGNQIQAVKVELTNGRTDYIVYSLDGDKEYLIGGLFRFKGFFGVYSVEDDQEDYVYLHDGEQFSLLSKEAHAPLVPKLVGELIDFTKELSIENELTISLELPEGMNTEDLVEKWIYIENDGVRNATYQILDIAHMGGTEYIVDIGDITLVRSFVDVNDFERGYVYDVAENAQFYIPLSYESSESDDSPHEVTLSELQQQLEAFIRSGAIQSPLTNQLTNRLKQAIHHFDHGRQKQSQKALEDMLKHLERPAHQDRIEASAKTTISTMIEALLAESIS